ncbi:type II secretion system F family protein [Desulfurivibrio alkaliphilus]|uniref:Type II secretion system F domain protein n=1 Tax=Desulfurivibrio alkaliphilus (strain DSM 19089 / UNIQEM U267 / AHT2) TaxID=589865 RepID=D6Z1Z3_DESAT|nr:type II secretion system F family protein [Desulfurivibrio alkaliphilus]ADH85568.1 Type II secretion system F domain protein [Desulfurivibrio alkaliphilus AHT 2]
MPFYVWKGVNSYGEKRKGKLEAPNEAAARAQLKRMRVTPSTVKEAPKDLFADIALFQPKVTGKDVVIFTRQLSTMIDAGLPLVQSLQILGDQQENPTFKKVLKEVRTDVETGSTFADSLKKHPEIFDNLYCNMMEAGEVGGILDTICSRLAVFMEKSQALQKKVKGAMTYPIICLAISLIVMAVMLIFVVPVFEEMFADFGSALPAPTQVVVNFSEFAQSYFIYMLIFLFLLVYAVKRIYKTEKGQLKIDDLLLRMPIVGTLLRRVAVAKFSRTLGTMLQSGVPILESLRVVARTAGNKVIERSVLRVTDSIREGRAIAEPLAETGVFPGMVVQMINVGEATGALDTMLVKIADFYDEEVDQAVENLTAAIEPLMMVFLGGMIGGLVVAMYLPIFGMAEAIG